MGADSEQACKEWMLKQEVFVKIRPEFAFDAGFQAGVESAKERETKLIRLLEKCALELHGWQSLSPRQVSPEEFAMVQECFDIVQEFDAASLSLQGRKQEK